jgi:hypothetical protein
MQTRSSSNECSFSKFRSRLKFESTNPTDPPEGQGGGGTGNTNPLPPPPDDDEEDG